MDSRLIASSPETWKLIAPGFRGKRIIALVFRLEAYSSEL
jgi:hypothetical protein